MDNPQVTILIPNYKTPDLTKLCLRLLRKYTTPGLAHIRVIDNDSQDASVSYLRGLKWIELLERPRSAEETPAASHANALDLALKTVDTPYVLSIHTDTLVKRPDWLPFLLSHIENRPQVAGVGSWKLESKPWLKRAAKRFEGFVQTKYYQLIDKKNHALEGEGDNYYYLRSHCALYRMDLIKALNLTFNDGEAAAGKTMHKKLTDAGYEMRFLPSEILGQYVDHINHATMILNPELGARDKTIQEGKKRIECRLRAVHAEEILADTNLDV